MPGRGPNGIGVFIKGKMGACASKILLDCCGVDLDGGVGEEKRLNSRVLDEREGKKARRKYSHQILTLYYWE